VTALEPPDHIRAATAPAVIDELGVPLRMVVPFRGLDAKRRLAPLGDGPRAELALAMLSDVLAACLAVGETTIVTDDGSAMELAEELGALTFPDPGGGQGAAVAAALPASGPSLVVNADLPCATSHDLCRLARAAPCGGLALVEAHDGTTNALALSSADVFAPVYGPGSAARFRALAAGAVSVVLPNLARDVDTLDDLERVRPSAGPRTRDVLLALARRPIAVGVAPA
jgi:2-phospho-L-lactate guanylyltransferase